MKKKYLFMLLLILLVSFCVFSNSGPFFIDEKTDVTLLKGVEVYYSDRKDVPVAEIAALPDSAFVKIEHDSVEKPDVSYKSFWVKVDLRYGGGPGGINVPLRMVVKDNIYSNVHRIEAYQVTGDGAVKLGRVTDTHIKSAFIFDLDKTELSTLYIYYESNLFYFDLQLCTIGVYAATSFFDYLVLGLFYGIILIMICHNLFLFFSLKNLNYLYYILFLGSIIITFMYEDGLVLLIMSRFTGYDYLLAKKFLFIAEFVLTTGFLLFSKQFLDLKKDDHFPRVNKVVNGFIIGLTALNGFMFFFLNKDWIDYFLQVSMLSMLIAFISMTVCAFMLLKRGFKESKFYVIAVSSLILTVVIYTIGGLNILPYAFTIFILNIKLLNIGVLVMIVFFSFALADRITILRQEKEEAQKASIVNLRRANKLKDEFLANTSHELRTPLHAIIGLARSMMDGIAGVLPERALENLSMIYTSGNRLFTLVNDILDFSKIKNDELTLDMKPVDVRSVLQHVLAFTPQLIGTKDIVVEDRCVDGLPLVYADENRLYQILFNLVGNALKFTSEGTVIIESAQHGDSIKISISDTGIGIPGDKLLTIFDSFAQVDGSVSRDYGGTGLGLTITKKLVELMGGTIGVESVVGEGSVFSFTVPLADSNADADLVSGENLLSAPVPSVVDGVSSDAVRGDARYSILVVDDDPINIEVVRNYLYGSDYSLVSANDGKQALELIEGDREFDLILLDIMMPGISGYEICRRLRETFSMYELPVIMLTAKAQIGDLAAGFDSGTNDYLTKPFNDVELNKRVKSLINLKTTTDANGILTSTNNLKSKLIRMASHDIKNPITSINTYSASLIKKALVTEKGKEIVGYIQNLSWRVDELVTSLLDNTKIKDGKLLLDKGEFDLVELVMDVIENNKMQAVKKNQRILIKTELFELLCHGDRGRIEQILHNLVTNACKYSGNGSVISIRVNTGQDGMVELAVCDQGYGFSDEDMAGLFQEFKTLSSAGKTDEPSIGLGLSIVKGLVELHEGSIRLESEIGKGSTFFVELPICVDEGEALV